MITQKSAEELKSLLQKVEQALTGASRPTKSLVVKTMAELDQCSKGSTGFEKSFLKALKAKNVPLTPKFAQLMDEQSTAAAPTTRTSATIPDAEKQAETTQVLSGLNLKGVSLIRVDGRGSGVACFIGGGEQSIGVFDESAFRLNSNLIEFNV